VIGVSRSAAAAIEQNHDAKGIIWPVPIAPFHAHLLPLSQSAAVLAETERLYAALQDGGVEVLWDDRDERAGVKFNDADLIGAPFHVVVGDKGLAQGTVEIKERKTGAVTKLPPAEVLPHLREQLRKALAPAGQA
jgi:prolyl-tRNA synthetase